MLSNHLPDGVDGPAPGYGFGLGFAIVEDPAATEDLGTVGEAAWVGAANTFFWIDQDEDLVYMVWTQLFPFGIRDFSHQMRALVHSSIVE